ncbi:MAG TPA: glycosyltransferase family 2 protein [Candidatus Polarisedimenticolia bacterium]|jgi:glycosyltransferase involved in cell wall biosynthesis|nr:glycosyltransferase family 2 protein [Candidatus Polarisedimenticolia bacterium]
MTPLPFVSIVMPCLNEREFIVSCLESVRHQDYPPERLEILVADGGSSDGTRQILERMAREDSRIRVIDNPDQLQACGMNAGIREACGELIVRMDVHCEYAADYVRRCVQTLARTGADNVGGAQRAKAKSGFQQAVCAALASPLGVGGARYRSPAGEGFVDTVFLGAFRRRAFETVGLYDRRAFTNEDAELNQRIRQAGGKVYLSRDIVVHYFPRGSFDALGRQYFRYGMGRARTFLKHARLPSLRSAVPFLMLAGGLALIGIPALRPLAPWGFGAYALLLVVEAVRVGRPDGVSTVTRVGLIFPVLHVCHGLGFATGLIRFAIERDWEPQERLPPWQRANDSM